MLVRVGLCPETTLLVFPRDGSFVIVLSWRTSKIFISYHIVLNFIFLFHKIKYVFISSSFLIDVFFKIIINVLIFFIFFNCCLLCLCYRSQFIIIHKNNHCINTTICVITLKPLVYLIVL